MTANESGNSIVITDTQANIHRVAEIIRDIDMSAEDVTIVHVFHLHYADATETATFLTSLFASDGQNNSQTPMQFGGGPGGGRFGRMLAQFGGGNGMFGQGNNSSGGNNSQAQNQRIKKRARVVAVADQRTASVAVTAAKDLMDQVRAVVEDLDADPANIAGVVVIPLGNADPQETLQVLNDTFGSSRNNNTKSTANQTSAITSRANAQSQQNNTTTRSSFSGSNMGNSGRTPSFGQ